jgi:hypothetical protein
LGYLGMSNETKSTVIAELEAMINDQSLQDDTVLTAQVNLILASKLIEAAGYEISQVSASEHTLSLVQLAAEVEAIAKKLTHP